MINGRGPKIGFLGVGFVGGAIAAAYDTIAHQVIRDPAKGHNATWEELKECEGIFISVPSPSKDNGECDASILEEVLISLKGYQGVIISKVTATPDIYERLQEQYPNLVYVPEFLTAANAKIDYLKESWAVFGGKVVAYQREAERIVKYAKPGIKTVFCTIGEASLYKYIINSFLATKVIFMNEMQAVASKNGYQWDVIRYMLSHDERVGNSHTAVPGPDGDYGFGGMCFPKDTSAILKYAESLECDLNVLSSAVKKNMLIRLKKSK